MSKFGWSYPPGVTHLPWYESYPCEVCCKNAEDFCDCPECMMCGTTGDPKCYYEHGLDTSRFTHTHNCTCGEIWKLCRDETCTNHVIAGPCGACIDPADER
jgi:hypothetical protein